MSDPIFGAGLRFERPGERAPEFIKGKLGINIPALKAFLDKHGAGQEWINLDLKESRGGKLYFQLNTWKPRETQDIKPLEYPEETVNLDDIPFNGASDQDVSEVKTRDNESSN